MPPLSYVDNQDVLDTLTKTPRTSLLAMLDEEGRVPRGSSNTWLSKISKQHKDNKRLKFPPGGRVFEVNHYAGGVAYDPSLFLSKNKDTLSLDLMTAMKTSSNQFIVALFEEEQEGGISASTLPSLAQRTSKVTVGTKFSRQLDSLVATLNDSNPQYIRQIKSNSEKSPGFIDVSFAYEQLRYSGIFDSVVIMKSGYPLRMSFLEFYRRYSMLVPERSYRLELSSKPPVERCRAVVEDFSQKDSDFQFGKTLIFYRSAQKLLLEKKRNEIFSSGLLMIQRSLRGSKMHVTSSVSHSCWFTPFICRLN